MTVLLVDDCVDVGNLVKTSLSHHSVVACLTIADASKALEDNKYDLLLIDAILPDGDGFALLTSMAGHPYYKNVPKIMLTSRSEVSDKVLGLEHGADDYITKPFHPLELKARVDLQLNRVTSKNQSFQNAFVKFDLDKQMCYCLNGEEWSSVNLTPLEFKIFLALVREPGKIKQRAELKNHIWGTSKVNIEIKGIDTHIAHIRKKLGPFADAIVSVYGSGYYFNPNPTRS